MQTEPSGKVLLRIDSEAGGRDVRNQLSAAALDPAGNLWLAGDEDAGVNRLGECPDGGFCGHRFFDLAERCALPEGDDEIDIEGLDFHGGRLWVAGSHTSTRKRAKAGRSVDKNLKRLATVEPRRNRFFIGWISVADGETRDRPAPRRLPISGRGNPLTKALRRDPQLGPFLHIPEGKHRDRDLQLASKENGFDVEGLAVRGDRVLLGLRGPVLRGWSLVLEIAPRKAGRGELRLRKIGSGGRPYRKHFVHLGGMGIRDLIWQGEDLLLLAGPTMDITGLQSIYRLRGAADLDDDSITGPEDPRLELAFHLPLAHGGDKAEGLVRYDGLGEAGLLVVYDAPRPERLVGADGVFADVFPLPES
jgi:hypothetical protein